MEWWDSDPGDYHSNLAALVPYEQSPMAKLMISWLVGGRDTEYALAFMHDLAPRLKNRVQLTTDGHLVYKDAVQSAFRGEVDYTQLVKFYEPRPGNSKFSRYVSSRKVPIFGNPDLDTATTAHSERKNLTVRMAVRRFSRATNAHSKKLEHHAYAVALYSVSYNFMRPHSSLGKRVTPAMAAGLYPYPLDMRWLLELMDAPKAHAQ